MLLDLCFSLTCEPKYGGRPIRQITSYTETDAYFGLHGLPKETRFSAPPRPGMAGFYNDSALGQWGIIDPLVVTGCRSGHDAYVHSVGSGQWMDL